MWWNFETSVVNHNGSDYWRTWFLEECEKSLLFGITERHLELIIKDGRNYKSYCQDTRIFLEDAPFFTNSENKNHRICGPYLVKPIVALPAGATRIHNIGDSIIVYKDLNPSRGPWYNCRNRIRIVDGHIIRFQQIAQ